MPRLRAPCSRLTEREQRVPRYFFHVFDGQTLPDREGTELPDYNHARREAISYAGKLLDDDASRIGLGEDWHMEVVDEAGLILFRLDFFVTTSPVLATELRK
jgi:hypothetical protein